MKAFRQENECTKLIIASAGVFLLTLAISNSSLAQNVPAERAGQVASEQSLADQVRSLQDKVARLEEALTQSYQRQSAPAVSGRGMGGMAAGSASQGGSAGMMGRGMMGGGMGMMQKRGPAQSSQGMSGVGGTSSMQPGQGMGMMDDMDMGETGMGGTSSMKPGQGMDMMGMGGMGATQPGRGMGGTQGMGGMMGRRPAGQGMAMGGMPMPSALPAFPGAVNIYHVGETDFFLDQAQRIALSSEQQTVLNDIKQRALHQDATYQRQIDGAEEQLWVLTSSDRPDIIRIETKMREIERLRSDRRLAFIRAVGEAAGVLTEDHRQALTTGASPSAMPSADQSAGPAQHQHQP